MISCSACVPRPPGPLGGSWLVGVSRLATGHGNSASDDVEDHSDCRVSDQ
jgi:hypothetical protein